MGRAEEPALAAMWRERIERQQRSGLSIAAFCQKQGLAMGTFYAWKRRFRTLQQKPMAVAKVGVASDTVPPRIHSERFVQIPMLSDSPIEVRFTDGTTVRVPVGQLALTLHTLKSLQPGGPVDV